MKRQLTTTKLFAVSRENSLPLVLQIRIDQLQFSFLKLDSTNKQKFKRIVDQFSA